MTLCSDPSGNIYSAGWFTNNNGNSYVAKWDRITNTWSELGGVSSLKGANHPILSIDSDTDGNLYAGGMFVSAPFEYYVAKWDKATNTWGELGGDHSLKANNWIQTVATDALGNVYAGGNFSNGSRNMYVAVWDKATNTWSELGGNNSLKANASILDICQEPSGNIYAAGSFLNSFGNYYVAKWDKATNTWGELGGVNSFKANGAIVSLAVDAAGNVYAGGYFKNVQGNYYVAKWDKATNTWSELGGVNTLKANNSIEFILAVAGNIYTAGYFKNSSGSQYVAKWDPTTNSWSELGGDNSLKANKFIGALTSDPKGEVYAAGGFYNSSFKCYVAHLAPPLAITTISPMKGCNGSPVTISGRGFTGATQVTIGGVPVLSFTVLSSSIITAVPANNSSGIVSVTTPIGTATFDGYATVVSQAAAISISCSENQICSGSTMNFSAATVNGGNNPSFQWEVNGISSGTNSSTFSTDQLSDGDVVRCVLMPDNVCLDPVTSNMIAVKVIAQETPNISISASDEFICEGEPVTFTAFPSSAGSAPAYQWKKNGADVGGNSVSFTATNFHHHDTISCVVTSTAACPTKTTAISNKVILTVAPKPVVILDRTDFLCEGSSRVLDAGTYIHYQWSNNSTDRTLVVDTIGTYYVMVTDTNGCSSSDTTHISKLVTPPHDFLPADTAICAYSKLELKSIGIFNHYLWSTNTAGPILTIDKPGTYGLQVIDKNGCRGWDEVVVDAKECLQGLYVPTAFTPNKDGKNDVLRAMLFGPVKQYQFTVYNRYGEVVFQTSDALKGWDGSHKGKTQDSNVFVWTCRYQLEGEEVKLEKGTVMLIR